jgi:serine/threonine protein kinase
MQRLSDGARHTELAETMYEYARPEKDDEIGANSAKPMERLKREIAILKESRTNLPKLLDSNADELWMVTEYFRNGTLADRIKTYRAEPLKALTAFRGLVETIATLHDAGVVHRDIKASNIFISDEGMLVPGDFGLAFTLNEEERLTLPEERIGP